MSIEKLSALRLMLEHNKDQRGVSLCICAGTACQASGSNDIIRAVKKTIIEKGLLDRVSLRITGCHGFCEMGPFVLVQPQQAFYTQVVVDDVPRIIDAALRGEFLEDKLYCDPATGKRCRHRDEIPFFRHQNRTILEMGQKVDPIRINDYIANGGYLGIEKALKSPGPEWVCEEVEKSGLRGRGGAGFPTGLKWKLLSKQPGKDGKYIVCNADEGDPGAYMDRSILEGNPHSIIEGMVIGAYATGAERGIVYVRNEYPIAIKHLNIALQQARELGVLGPRVLGTDVSFDIEIVQGAGAFVCGEETALIRSIEGKMGEPRQRPPYPIQSGIQGKPTLINNVETWANIPIILKIGADEFSKVGTPNNAGTKIFSLVGKIRNTGLVEVPMGATINSIVYDIGGGPVGKAKIKAVQTGGPSGGCIPAHLFDLPIDYDSLAKAGSIMGSGGMIVMDENTCMVDLAKYFMGFLKGESCGKCFSCRKGTQRMYEILDDISQGKATLEHIDLLEELAHVVKDTTMCGLGQTASNPVLSTLRYFRHEYVRHVVDKRCDAFVCSGLVGAPCQAACPLDTEPWRYIALVEKGQYEEAYKVIRDANPFPSVCARVCDRKCETRCKLAASGSEPLSIRALKRFVTDRVDASAYRPAKPPKSKKASAKVAVVGAGPAGLTAAHHLSMLGYGVTLFEAENEPGGMLNSCIPAYRLPRDVMRKEIATLLDERITLECGMRLGRDITLDGLFGDGYKAVFVATGASDSWTLGLEGENLQGVYSSMEFLKAFNLRGEQLAGGHVGIIGGGNSAVDAARVAMRQEAVESVTLLYRRTCDEMPAYAEEVEAAIEEGIQLETLVSPVRIRYIETAMKEGVHVETMVEPVKIHFQNGRLVGIECVRNSLGEIDSSGRRKPVAMPGTEFRVPLNTLIVAIGERPNSNCVESAGVDTEKDGRIKCANGSLMTSRPGVFVGGDVARGPNTVVDAIADGRKAAEAIDRYLLGKELVEPAKSSLPKVFIDPAEIKDDELDEPVRAIAPTIPVCARNKNFSEVELSLSVEAATQEARRCLRCDLQFTRLNEDGAEKQAAKEGNI